METKEIKKLIREAVLDTILVEQPKGWGSAVQPPWEVFNDGVRQLEYKLLKLL